MTRTRVNAKGEGMMFSSLDEARRAFEAGHAELQAMVKVRAPISEVGEDGEMVRVRKVVDTTVGRALLSEILPHGLSFDLVNRAMSKKAISNVINASCCLPINNSKSHRHAELPHAQIRSQDVK